MIRTRVEPLAASRAGSGSGTSSSTTSSASRSTAKVPSAVRTAASTALRSAWSHEMQIVNDLSERAFRRHYGDVYRFVRRRTRDHHEAEELAQQVFADAAASLRADGRPPLAWLYAVAKRRFADEARRRRVRADTSRGLTPV